MPWQDIAFTLGSAVLAATLLPTITDSDAAVPRRTSVPTMIVLYGFAFIYMTMDFWMSAGISMATAFAWAVIAIARAPD